MDKTNRHSIAFRQTTYDPVYVTKIEEEIEDATKIRDDLFTKMTILHDTISSQELKLKEMRNLLKRWHKSLETQIQRDNAQMAVMRLQQEQDVGFGNDDDDETRNLPENIDVFLQNRSCQDTNCIETTINTIQKNIEDREAYIEEIHRKYLIIKHKYEKYHRLVDKYDSELLLYKKEHESKMKKRDIDNHNLIKKYNNQYKLRSQSSIIRMKRRNAKRTNPQSKTMLDAFQRIKQAITTGFLYGSFDDGCSETVRITSKLEIVLMIDKQFVNKNKNVEITIRFRVPTHIKSCIKMTVRRSEPDTIVIDKVNMDNCSELNVSKHCFIMLALMLCTFLAYRVVEVKDYDHYDRTNPKLSFRESKYINTSNQMQPYKYMYSHNFSYFDDYGFYDSIYNEEDPVMINCTKDYTREQCLKTEDPVNNRTIKFQDIDDDKLTFIAMHKFSDTVPELTKYLKSIVLMKDHDQFIEVNDFCKLMQCTTDGCYRSLTSFILSKNRENNGTNTDIYQSQTSSNVPETMTVGQEEEQQYNTDYDFKRNSEPHVTQPMTQSIKRNSDPYGTQPMILDQYNSRSKEHSYNVNPINIPSRRESYVSPHVSSRVSPHVSSRVSPHVSPRVSSHDSPQHTYHFGYFPILFPYTDRF